MNALRKIFINLLMIMAIILLPGQSSANEFTIYSVYQALNMGNPGEVPPKDFFINMGSAHGLQPGSTLEVVRRISTYDLTNQKLFKDMSFPFAKVKVIHVESNAAIARLVSVEAVDKVPALAPRAVMVGDIVRPAR